MNQLPPFFYLHHILEISTESPSGLIWKVSNSNRIKTGSQAGSLDKKRGVWQIGIDNVSYLAHRIIFYMENNVDPLCMEIDHKDRNPGSNINNLRLATSQQNKFNRGKNFPKLNKSFTSNYKGVSWDKETEKWKASITLNYKTKTIGRFNTEEEAAFAYNNLAEELFKEYAFINALH